MKIEKINDNQIRCTLTSDDLAKRQIRISELAYGTEKAKNRAFDSLIIQKVVAGRIKPALFLSTFLLYYIAFSGILWYTVIRRRFL